MRAAAVRAAGLSLAATILVGGAGYAWLKAFAPPALGPVPLPLLRTYRWADELAVWMKENLPSDSVVFAYDYPGTLAWRSGLRVVPADGLVNDFDYDAALRDEGLTGWLCSRGVTHYFGADVPGGGTWGPRGQIVVHPSDGMSHAISLETPLTRSDAGRMILPDAARVVRVPRVVARPAHAPPLAIWSLGPTCRDHASSVPSSEPSGGGR